MAAELLRRDFTVDAPLDAAWRTLANVTEWPRWAPHLRRVTVTPSGSIGPTSTGSLSFRPVGASQFRVSSYSDGPDGNGSARSCGSRSDMTTDSPWMAPGLA